MGRRSRRDRPRRRAGAMSEDEAHEVLGLAKSATREEITRAHRALMKKFHPGSRRLDRSRGPGE